MRRGEMEGNSEFEISPGSKLTNFIEILAISGRYLLKIVKKQKRLLSVIDDSR